MIHDTSRLYCRIALLSVTLYVLHNTFLDLIISSIIAKLRSIKCSGGLEVQSTESTELPTYSIPNIWIFFLFAQERLKTCSESLILLFNTFVLARRPMVCDEVRTFPIG